jgi:hypothetical protein
LQLASLPSTSLKQNMNVANFWGIALRSPGWTEVSEGRITSIFRVENQTNKKPECSRCLGRIRFSETSIHIRSSWRYIPENANIHNYRWESLKSFKTNYHSYSSLHVSARDYFHLKTESSLTAVQ